MAALVHAESFGESPHLEVVSYFGKYDTSNQSIVHNYHSMFKQYLLMQ